ncbi:MAG: nucleotidyltransferase domain-containing protein [Hyphomicrobium sp.]
MNFIELDNEQRRQLIDTVQTYQTWRPATIALDGIGSLHWQGAKPQRYLIEKHGIVRKSHGRETEALRQRKTEFDARKKALKARATASGKRLERMARVNTALNLGRLRRIVAKILRELDQEGLLGTHVIVVGTNALHAYETEYGVLIGSEHVATTDADLLWDARKSLQLASTSEARDGLMGILRRVDPSFNADYGFNATNAEGYIVDLLSPEMVGSAPLLGSLASSGLEATEMPGMSWLLDAPRLEQTIIADDGWPVRMVVPEPRTFALHKLWVSRQSSRKALSSRKDQGHAALVTRLALDYSNARMVAKDMPWLPKELRALIKDATAAAKSIVAPTDS